MALIYALHDIICNWFQQAVIASLSAFVHELVDRTAGLYYPFDHRGLDIAAAVIFIVAPAWIVFLAFRAALRWGNCWRRRAHLKADGLSNTARTAINSGAGFQLEIYITKATLRLQLRLVTLSLLTLPGAWLLLEIPKHIVNHALSEPGLDGHPQMLFFGLHLDRIELLFALCVCYFVVLSISGWTKYAANRVRGRVNERLVRRLRLAIHRRARSRISTEHRAILAAVAVQEVEPVGYFAGSLVVVPLIQGGTLMISVIFLLFQNVALAFAALLMLPVQLTFLPPLQRKLNGKVRERVYATRALGRSLTASKPERLHLAQEIRQTEELERIRIDINDLKGRLKGLYNYTSNLTPFLFFTIGGYLVVQQQLTLGALVAALTAYREIAPALRGLFDYGQSWSDARARFEEVTKALAPSIADQEVGDARGGVLDNALPASTAFLYSKQASCHSLT